jgi:heme/copper-type cytochrome/quinol oxidase subunit 1
MDSSSTRRTMIAWIAGVLAAAVGLALVVAGTVTPVTFGWFAYAPQTDTESFPGDLVVLRRSTVAGAVLLIAGLVTVAVLVGMRLGARRSLD